MSTSDRTDGRDPAARQDERLPVGQQVRDRRSGQIAAIVDWASQYAHPKAEPVFVYLLRWEDGQVQSVTEYALGGGGDLELIEE